MALNFHTDVTPLNSWKLPITCCTQHVSLYNLHALAGNVLLAKLDGFGTNRGIIWLKLVLQMSKSFVPHKLALVLLGCHLCGKLPLLDETFSCHTGISQHGCGKKWMMDGPQEFLPSIELQNDLGFHCWKPPRNPWKVHRELKRRNVTADEIKRGSVVDQPLRCQLVDVKKLRFPMIFKDPSELRRQFAHGSYMSPVAIRG